MTERRLEVADVFRQHKQEFFTRWGHTLSARQRKVFRDICACRTPRSARGSNNATTVITNTPNVTRAVIGTA